MPFVIGQSDEGDWFWFQDTQLKTGSIGKKADMDSKHLDRVVLFGSTGIEINYLYVTNDYGR